MRANIAAAILGQIAKLSFCQVRVPALAGLFAEHIVICLACRFTMPTTRWKYSPNESIASLAKLKSKSDVAVVSESDKLSHTARPNGFCFLAPETVIHSPTRDAS